MLDRRGLFYLSGLVVSLEKFHWRGVPFMTTRSSWQPPSAVSYQEVLRLHFEVAAMPDLPLTVREDLFGVHALEMDWDIGVVVYQPQDSGNIVSGPDGKKIGIFLLHGGVSDFKSVEGVAQTLAKKFAVKVAAMTFPGRFYFLDGSRDWPGDVENRDGSARTPLWTKDTRITPDQYAIVKDQSKRKDYGTLISLSAKPGTEFYDRMAAWPAAFEEAIKETARRQFPHLAGHGALPVRRAEGSRDRIADADRTGV
jgi:hypothetical protein